MANDGNGWREGRDPILRWLRAATVVAFVAVFVLVSLDRDRDGSAILTILSIAGGAVLILLGYQGVVRLPYIGDDRSRTKDGDRKEGE
jgi:threonine/homoserine/homoserine lactone efflux protein